MTELTTDSTNDALYLNPRLTENEKKELNFLFHKFAMGNHVWLTSSGSTQKQNESLKLIALSKKAILTSAKAVNEHLKATSQDKWLRVLPLFHIGGLAIEFRASLLSSEVINADEFMEKWDPFKFKKICFDHKIQFTSLVPTQVFDLVSLKLTAPSSLKAILVGGGKLQEKLYQEAIKLGWPLLPSFGMTETSSQIATAKLGDPSLILLSHVEVQTSEQGFLKIKSDSLLTGYAQIKNGEAKFIDPINQEGWLETQDYVQIQNQVLIPQGRGQDFVKILGEGVNLFKLQEVLEAVLAQEAYIVAVPDARKENDLIVVSSQPVETQKLQEFNKKVLPFERVSQSVVVEKLPKTAIGKINWKELQLLLISRFH